MNLWSALPDDERASERVAIYAFAVVLVIVAGGVFFIWASAAGKAGSIADVVGAGMGVIGTLGGAIVGHRLGSAKRREDQTQHDNVITGRLDEIRGLLHGLSNDTATAVTDSTEDSAVTDSTEDLAGQ
jgi:hypothetical protein